MTDPKILVPMVIVTLFVLGALLWSRFGLHRTMATMPALAGETVLHEVKGTVIHHTGGRPAKTEYRGALLRITDRRVLVSQAALGGGDAMAIVVLWGDAEPAMRAADPEALTRLGSFRVVKVREVQRTPEGALLLVVDALWPAVEPPYGPAKLEFPAPIADRIAEAMTR